MQQWDSYTAKQNSCDTQVECQVVSRLTPTRHILCLHDYMYKQYVDDYVFLL